MNYEKYTNEINSMIDASMVLQKCGLKDNEKIKELESIVCSSTSCSQVEHIYYFFKLYQLTDNEFFRIEVKERLKTLLYV